MPFLRSTHQDAGSGSSIRGSRRIVGFRKTVAESDFLIYSRSQKDLSPRGLEGNWLADVELIAEHFQADDWCYKAIDACGPFDDSDNPEERLHKPLPYARYALEHYGQPLEGS